MTIDLLSGNITKIRVEDQEFDVVKHIHSSLVLFGRGTHVFVVRDKDGTYHILKDAWLLVDHGISEITVLSEINHILNSDSSEDAKAYRSMHPRFIVGQELGDSTRARRGRLTDTPPDCVHHRVVTGPVGDPITSFRSRVEFVQVILDCVKWLDFLHNKCKKVHGDLSINNIVIYRSPPAHPPPPKASNLKSTDDNMPMRITRHTTQQHLAPFVLAPLTGLDEDIPVVGTVIDYDYARPIDTNMQRTSGTLPFMPLDALDNLNSGKYIHTPAHDLESLLQTVLGIVSFTNGPCGKCRPHTEHIPVAQWYNEIDREQLFKDKAIDLICYNREVDSHIPEYWKPFPPYLHRLVSATWPGNNPVAMSSQASHCTKMFLKRHLKLSKRFQKSQRNMLPPVRSVPDLPIMMQADSRTT
ncbi:hypothetical protein BDZ97DRAFT_1669192 [Flammula alnicola]|nr:hypothetical protein BDZ97DRAFT_1669192 [Flammula alnicola]